MCSAGPSSVARPRRSRRRASRRASRSVTGLSLQPRATAAAATATADEPDAAVSPAPRSQTSDGDDVARLGARELDVRAVAETADASRSRARAGAGRRARARSRSTTACGLPTSTGTIVSRSPARSSSSSSDDVDLAELLTDDAVRRRRARPGRRPPGASISTSVAPVSREQPRGRDPRPVARHLGGRAVRVPDRHARARAPSRVDDLEHAVAADSGADVAEPPHAVSA